MSEELNDDIAPVKADHSPAGSEESEIITEPTSSALMPEILEPEENEESVKVKTAAPRFNKKPVGNQAVAKSDKDKDPEVDHVLVEAAVQEITKITSNHLSDMMLEVGQYLIKTFFDGDYEAAKKKKGNKIKSLHQVIKQIVQSGEKDYSKSWMYNSINLVLESKAFESFQSYGKLSSSCKVLLLPVKDELLKKELIEKAAEENLSVSKLRTLIKEGKPNKPKDLVSFLKKVKSVQNTTVEDILQEFNTLNLAKEEYDELKGTIQNQINKYNTLKVTIDLTLAKYREVNKEIEKSSNIFLKNKKSHPSL